MLMSLCGDISDDDIFLDKMLWFSKIAIVFTIDLINSKNRLASKLFFSGWDNPLFSICILS